MRQRANEPRQPRRLPLGGIRPDEEDLVRIVLGLQPRAVSRKSELNQSASPIRFVTSLRYLTDRIDAK